MLRNDVSTLDLSGINLVVGLGKTGLSCVRTLKSLGAEVMVTDNRLAPPELKGLETGFPTVPRHLGGFDPELFAKARRILISPGIAVTTPPIARAAARGVPVWGDIELFARLNHTPVAAITGSNGKSTVTTLLGLMAERAGVKTAIGGNLGPPALDLLNRANAELDVLELSSFQLETTSSLNARAAVVLNISPDHLDRYTDLNDYVQAKRRIYRGDGYMVINVDDPLVATMIEPDRPTLCFTLNEPKEGEFGLCRRGDEIWLAHGDDCWLVASDLKIRGRHNLTNALAALAMGYALGLERGAMLSALRDFSGLPHRTQLVVEHQGVRWFNDSKGTNVGATVAAVHGLPGHLVLIAGGEGKGQDFTPLREALADKARGIVLIGRDAPLIERAINQVIPVCKARDMDEAVILAAELAHPGDSVLLSPACASFDMFSNYEERGTVFAHAARRLVGC